ncbi:MAG: aldo/keto reductase [Gammaproteobacteria bacterium]|nr:MAG: aldo/keto reductase [Gammaproteobacteria bacterium]
MMDSIFDVPFALGMMRLPDYPALAEPSALADWISRQVEAGFTLFDHADIYGAGECETRFGEALKAAPALKANLQVITKADIVTAQADRSPFSVKHYDTTRAYLMQQAEQSLSRLNLERIDVFLIHRPDPLMPAEETARALEDLVAQGKVGQVGVSNFLPEQWRWLQANLNQKLVCNQVQLSLTVTDMLVSGQLEAHLHDGLKLLAWSPLAGGQWPEALSQRLAQLAEEKGVAREAIALAWLKAIPGMPLPVVGTCNPERLAACAQVTDVQLNRPEWYALWEAARGHRVP